MELILSKEIEFFITNSIIIFKINKFLLPYKNIINIYNF
jgi:hypothetical protein